MTLRDTFWFLAGVLITVALWSSLRSLSGRRRPEQGAGAALPPFAVPTAAVLALAGLALGIYFLMGSPPSLQSDHPTSAAAVPTNSAVPVFEPSPPAEAGSLDEVTSKLSARLAAKGGTDDEWRLLAQSYEYLGRPEDAKAAERHVIAVVPQGDGQTSIDHPSMPAGSQMAAIADALDARPSEHHGSRP